MYYHRLKLCIALSKQRGGETKNRVAATETREPVPDEQGSETKILPKSIIRDIRRKE